MDLTCNRTWQKQYQLLLLQTIWAFLSSRRRHEYLSFRVTVTPQTVRPGQSLKEFSIRVNACTVCDNQRADGRLAGWKLAMDQNIVSWVAVGMYPAHIVHAEEECLLMHTLSTKWCEKMPPFDGVRSNFRNILVSLTTQRNQRRPQMAKKQSWSPSAQKVHNTQNNFKISAPWLIRSFLRFCLHLCSFFIFSFWALALWNDPI